MASFAADFPFTFGGDIIVGASCWDPDNSIIIASSPISPIEARVASPLPTQALDVLRRFFLQTTTTDREPRRAARAVVQLAFEAELRTLMSGVDVPVDVLEANLCTRASYLAIDRAMRTRAFLYRQAVSDAVARSVVTPAYAPPFLTRLFGTSPRTRACATAALLVLCAAKLVP